MSTIKIRTKPLGGKTLVRILIDHPMETGRRKDEATGKPVPAHYITELRVEHNGAPVVTASLSTAISRNPYFSFRLNNAMAGDRLRVSWLDNLGQRDSAETKIGTAS